ncbi:hypothetical protein Q5N58_17700, partial [Vibrio cholerae]|uniref:hypothetical protein n=1 Tax=Vibrio cholerae TaxID=666 RepID=UPI0029348985
LNSNTTTATTAAQWDWKRRALTVPLEAFVMYVYATSFLITFLMAISIVQYRFLPTPHRFLGLKQSEKQ